MKKYIVREYRDSWIDWEIKAESEEEALEKYAEGEIVLTSSDIGENEPSTEIRGGNEINKL